MDHTGRTGGVMGNIRTGAGGTGGMDAGGIGGMMEMRGMGGYQFDGNR